MERIVQFRDKRIPYDGFVVGKSIVPGLDSSIRAEDVTSKENCIPMIYKNELERLGTPGHPMITPSDHHLLGKKLGLSNK